MNNKYLQKFGLSGLGLIVALSTSCENPQAQNKVQKNQITTIKVGEGKILERQNYLERLTYNGMNSETTFSMSIGRDNATNIFFPSSIKEFSLHEFRFKLEKVTPEHITLTYIE